MTYYHMAYEKKNNVFIVLKKIITLFLYDRKPLWQNSRMNHKTSVSVYNSLHYMSVVLLMKPFTWFIKCVCVFSRFPFLPCTHFSSLNDQWSSMVSNVVMSSYGKKNQLSKLNVPIYML